MKVFKSTLFRCAFIIGCSTLLLANNSANTASKNPSSPPAGRTGAPFDNTCNASGCHSTVNNNFDGNITISGLPTSIVPNTAYSVTLQSSVTMGSPSKSGFQLVAVSTSTNAQAGTLTAGTGSNTTTLSGRTYVRQSAAKTITGGMVSWTFTWTAPASVAGNNVTFYATSMLCDGNGGNDNDKEIFASLAVPMMVAPPTATITQTNVSCNGGSDGTMTVNASGGTPPYTYNWSNGQMTQTITGLPIGTFNCTVTDAASQSTQASSTITQPTALNANATATGTITCVNMTANLNVTASGATPPYTYAWPNGATTAATTVSAGGVYTATVTDSKGCTKTASATVQSNTTPPNAAAGPANPTLTCVQSQVTLNGNGSSTGANFAYLWTASAGGNIVSGATTLTPVVNAAGTYTIRVTNTTNGCTNTASVDVVSNINPPTATATGGTITCTNPTTTVNVTTNANSPTFLWTGPMGFTSPLQNPTVSNAGVYNVVVTDGTSQCTKSTTATVTANNTPPTAAAVSANTLTCIQTTSQITLTTNANPATFLWSGPNGYTSTLQNPVVSVGGTYSVVVTNTPNGCTKTASVVVSANQIAPSANATTSGSLTCTTTSVQLNATTNGQNPSFLWMGPGGASMLQNPTVSMPGTYSLVVTDGSNGCTGSSTTSVSQNTTPPGATAIGGTQTCTSPTIQLQGSATAPNTTFSWTGPNNYASSLQNPTVDLPGNYTLTTNDPTNGCTSTATATVSQDIAQPTATASSPGNLNCNNAQIQLNGNGSSSGAQFAYVWTTADGCILSGNNTLTPTVGCAGTYNLLVSNTANGCTATTSVLQNQSAVVTANTNSIVNVSCNGGSNGAATATGGGGNGTFSFIWSNGATTASISNLAAGTYSATVTDGENCSATASATILQPAVLNANASATAETSNGANDGTATAAPSGGTLPYSFLWNNGSTTTTISNLAPGVYTVSVTDANGCTTSMAVTVNAFGCAITATASSTDITCNGAQNGTATATTSNAAPTVTYLWSNGATTAMISNLSVGMFSCQILDGNGCPATVSVSINQPPVLLPNASSTNETAAGVHDGTATAQPTGGTAPYSFLWNTGATTATITGLSAGSYTVVVTDGNGCTADKTVVVSAFNCSFSGQVAAQNATCFGSNNGSAAVNLTGGSAPFSYLWSNGATTSSVSNLAPGSFSVQIQDVFGCATGQTFQITEPTQLTSLLGSQNVVCPEATDGSAFISLSGGTAPYNYLWSNGATTSNVSGLGVGPISVVATDANGCSVASGFNLISTDSEAPMLTCPQSVSVCSGEAVLFGLPIFSDNCSLGNHVPMLIAGLPIGSIFPIGVTAETYELTDASGNVATCSFNVTVNQTPNFSIISTQNDKDDAGVGSITINSNGSTFIWKKDGVLFSNNQNLTGLHMGSYVVEITSAEGCTFVSSPILIQNTVAAGEPTDLSGLHFSVVPNPATTSIRVEKADFDLRFLKMLDSRGRLVLLIENKAAFNEIAIEQLADGLYFLQAVALDGRTATVRFVKGH